MIKNELLSYENLLSILKDQKESHLLLGNGFNLSLGVLTDYETIFNEMKAKNVIYDRASKFISEEFYDIEKFIGKLVESLNNDILNDFLPKFFENKVKKDFMLAVNTIVNGHLKKIYQEKNEDIYLLFEKFDSYLTLNYDPLLYLLLLKFKKKNTTDNLGSLGGQELLSFSNTSKYIEQDLNSRENEIYQEILSLRKGAGNVSNGKGENIVYALNSITKTDFIAAVKAWNKTKSKGWKGYEIEKVCNLILDEETIKPNSLYINDGFSQNGEDFIYNPDQNQNLFFLHGCFYYKKSNNGKLQKITGTESSFMRRLSKLIENHEDILCILASKSEDKVNQINDSSYLSQSFHKLASLSGNLVIFGSSLDRNDSHIYDQINSSSIEKIYISCSCQNYGDEQWKASKEIVFPEKEVFFFDYGSVSYQK